MSDYLEQGSYEIDGLDELIANLTKLPEAFGKFALEDAGRYALVPFIATVRELVPVDDPKETKKRKYAHLRDSYIISTNLNARQKKLNKNPKYVEVYAGTADPIGHLIEFGHFAVGRLMKGRNKKGEIVGLRDTGKVHSWVPPQPHVGPAWTVTAPEVLQRAASEMERNLDNAVRAMNV